jgi:hypothetical protein
MGKQMRKRAKIGDIIEIEAANGSVFAQYTHEDKSRWCHGALIRVFPGIHRETVVDYSVLSAQIEQFIIFFPLHAAVQREIARVVDHQPVPEWAREFPVFRVGVPYRPGAKIEDWWLRDQKKEWRIGPLPVEYHSFPIMQIANDTSIIDKVESGWTAEQDV